MKSSTKVILVASLLSALGLGSLAKAISANQSPSPVAIMPQHRNVTKIAQTKDKDVEVNEGTEKPDSANDADNEVKDDQVPASLSKVGEYGETVYDMAKANDWTKATANLTLLKDAAKRLRADMKNYSKAELAQLDSKIAALKGAVTAKNRQAAMPDANQVTLSAAKMTMQFEPKVPVEVTLLDYYGRELEIWSATENTAKLKITASEMRRTWDAVQPSILSRGGTAQAQKFDALVARVEAAKSPSDYGRLATPVLNEVDNLDKVFK